MKHENSSQPPCTLRSFFYSGMNMTFFNYEITTANYTYHLSLVLHIVVCPSLPCTSYFNHSPLSLQRTIFSLLLWIHVTVFTNRCMIVSLYLVETYVLWYVNIFFSKRGSMVLFVYIHEYVCTFQHNFITDTNIGSIFRLDRLSVVMHQFCSTNASFIWIPIINFLFVYFSFVL